MEVVDIHVVVLSVFIKIETNNLAIFIESVIEIALYSLRLMHSHLSNGLKVSPSGQSFLHCPSTKQAHASSAKM